MSGLCSESHFSDYLYVGPRPKVVAPTLQPSKNGSEVDREEPPNTLVFPELMIQNGTAYTGHPHRVIVSTTPKLRVLVNPRVCREYMSLHRCGTMLLGVEDPYAGETCSWTEAQQFKASLGERSISLFAHKGECFAIWTCFSSPQVPSTRFAMTCDEFVEEYRHGFPVEKRFESIEFPLGEDGEEVVADFADSDPRIFEFEKALADLQKK